MRICGDVIELWYSCIFIDACHKVVSEPSYNDSVMVTKSALLIEYLQRIVNKSAKDDFTAIKKLSLITIARCKVVTRMSYDSSGTH